MWKGKQRSGPEEEDEAEDRGNGYVFHSFSVSGSVLRSVLGRLCSLPPDSSLES